MTNIYYSQDYLEHHGILGQKWGIRRFQNKDGSYTNAGKERRKKEETGYQKYKRETSRKTVEKMSNKRLDQQIERMRKEQTYKELKKQQNLSKGQQFVDSVLGSAGKQAAKVVVTGAMVYAGKKLCEKYFPGMASEINKMQK